MNAIDSGPEWETRGPADLLLGLFLEELRATAHEDEERAFCHAAGGRLAWRFPVTGSGSLNTLEQELNGIFAAIGLGSASLSVTHDALYIRHDTDLQGNPGKVLPSVLEGAYDAWLRSLGSGADLMTTVEDVTNNMVTLRHGR